MPVFSWGQSWDSFRDLERDMDRLLESVNLTFQGVRPGRQYPAINVHELPDAFLLTAELPATTPEDLELTITSGVLTISGRREEKEIAEERYRRQERPRGAWQRSLPVPERVQEDRLTAEFSDGVLTVHLPKAEETEPRQISVTEG